MKILIIIIDDYYFDLTMYAYIHPGGINILKKFHLKDATEEFNKIKGHSDSYVISELDKYCIGHIKNIDIKQSIKKKYDA